MRVLLAVSDPRGLRLFERVLRERGHDVTCCETIDQVAEARERREHELSILGSRYIGAPSPAAAAHSQGIVGGSPAFVLAVAEEDGAAECAKLVRAGATDVILRMFDEPLVLARIAIAEEFVRQARSAGQAVAALEARARESEAVAEMGQLALEGLGVSELLDHAVKAVAAALDVEFVKVAEVTADGTELLLRAGIGWKQGLVGRARMSAANGSQGGFAIASGAPVVVDDLRREKRFRHATLLRQHGVVSGVSVPIRGPSKPVGVLGAHTARSRAFTRDDVLFLQSAANVLGAALARAHAEELLRESEERGRHVLESALDGVVAMDADHAITFWNAGAEEVFGWSRLEALGRSLPDLIIPPRDREAHREGLQQFLRSGEGSFLNRRLEVAALRRGGAEFPAELTIAPIRTRAGFSFYAFVRDLSERHRAEQALKDSERFSRRLVEATPHAAFVLDLENLRLDFVSERADAVMGWPAAELLALGSGVLGRILHPTDRAGLEERLGRWASVGDDDVVETEVRIADRSGRWRWIRSTAKAFSRSDEGRIRQIVGTIEDITRARRVEDERRALEARLREAQKAETLGVLAGGIAHDFNNLLTSVLGNAALAGLDLPDDVKARGYLARIETATRRAADLTGQLLAYAGKGRLTVERIDLAALVDEMAGLLKTVVSKDVRLVACHASGVPGVEGDATQVRQVLMNLITNAAEACAGRPGEVRISTGKMEIGEKAVVGIGASEPLAAGAYAVLEVADSGSGMDAATLLRIFDPFFTTKRTGRGLGLAAALGIVRAHGGAIRVHSQPGVGSTFEVILPAAGPRGDAVQPAPKAREWHGTGTVLLVDDEEDIRVVAGTMLRSMGFHVLESADGEAAVQTLERHGGRVELVVLDLTMPGMDGAQTLEALRRIRPGLRVLVASGYAADDVRERFARGERPNGYLQKPFTVEDIRAAIGDVLGQKPVP